MIETDIVIIGAGPVGLFTIFQAGMLKMRCHVVDTLEMIGGQCSALYPEKPIYDIPAHPSIEAQDLIKKLEQQAAPFKPVYHLGEVVEKLEKTEYGYLLTSSKNTQISCKVVMIAAGCGAFGPNRPPLAGIEEYEGKSVFYMVVKREDYRDKTIVIAGGGDSAVDWAISLASIAKKVFVVHRRAKFRCAPESAAKLEELAKSGVIELVIPYQLAGLEGENGKLETVIVEDLDGNKRSIKADILLPFFGLSTELGAIANWGLGVETNHILVDQSTMMTNITGIYAIGDVATYKGKLKLILSGFAESATACHDAYSIVNDGKALHFEHSTSRGIG